MKCSISGRCCNQNRIHLLTNESCMRQDWLLSETKWIDLSTRHVARVLSFWRNIEDEKELWLMELL